MHIQAITNNLYFTSSRMYKKVPDRAATVQELYEMEDRINAKNKENIRKQNELMGNALSQIIEYIDMQNSFDSNGAYKRATRAAKELERSKGMFEK